jgi:hypothetical protein
LVALSKTSIQPTQGPKLAAWRYAPTPNSGTAPKSIMIGPNSAFWRISRYWRVTIVGNIVSIVA